jgi:hypothetical protein
VTSAGGVAKASAPSAAAEGFQLGSGRPDFPGTFIATRAKAMFLGVGARPNQLKSAPALGCHSNALA